VTKGVGVVSACKAQGTNVAAVKKELKLG